MILLQIIKGIGLSGCQMGGRLLSTSVHFALQLTLDEFVADHFLSKCSSMSGSRDNYITPAESDCLAQIECERSTDKQVYAH